MFKIVIEPNMTDSNHLSELKKKKFERIYNINCPIIEDALRECIKDAKTNYDGDNKKSCAYKREIPLKCKPSIFIPSLCPNYDRIISETCKNDAPRMRVCEEIPKVRFIPLINYPLSQKSVTLSVSTGDFYKTSSIDGRGFGFSDMLYREWGSKVKYWNIV